MVSLYSSYQRGIGWILIILLLCICNGKVRCETILYSAEIPWQNDIIKVMTMPNGKTYCKVDLPTSKTNIIPGTPDIPYMEYNFLVPDGAGNFTASIQSVETRDSSVLSFPIIPAQMCWSVNDLDNKPFLDIDTWQYKSSNAQLNCLIAEELYVNGKYHVVKVYVPVMEYSPIFLSTKLYSKVNLKLDFDMDVAPHLSIADDEETLDEIVDLVVNCPQRKTSAIYSSSQTTLLSPTWYYILTPESLLNEVSEMGTWKKQKGYEVKIITYEEILSSEQTKVNGTTILDPADAVRQWLISERKKNGKFYLLLIGDSRTSSPFRKFRYKSEYDATATKNWCSGQFIPSDGYYSDMTTNYNLTKENDGHYSEYVENCNFSPDLMVGRILANKNSEISNYFKKLLTYELLPNNNNNRYDYLNCGLIVRQYQHRTYSSLFYNLNDFPDSVVLTDNNGYADFNKSTPTGEMVISNMKNCGLISLMGHGTPTTFACSGANTYPGTTTSAGKEMRYIKPLKTYGQDLRWLKQDEDNNSLDLLSNKGKPSIVYTLACDIIPFDSLFNQSNTASFLPYNMGEAFTVAGDFGGVAFIGNTRTGLDWCTREMESEFGKQISRRISIGDAFNQSSYATTNKYAKYSRNLIGDPELKIWIGKPNIPNVKLDSNSSSVNITGEDIQSSKVIIYDGVSSKSYIIGSGVSNVSFSRSEYGNDFLISIFKDNFIPLSKLYANNSILTKNKNYILTNTVLEGYNNPAYIINQNGTLTLNCIESFESIKGFAINSGGLLDLKCDGQIKLSLDKVSNGGCMIIKGKNIEIDDGFTVDKGGKITIENI